MPPPTLNSEEPLNAPFGARCFLTGLQRKLAVSKDKVLMHLLVLGAF